MKAPPPAAATAIQVLLRHLHRVLPPPAPPQCRRAVPAPPGSRRTPARHRSRAPSALRFRQGPEVLHPRKLSQLASQEKVSLALPENRRISHLVCHDIRIGDILQGMHPMCPPAGRQQQKQHGQTGKQPAFSWILPLSYSVQRIAAPALTVLKERLKSYESPICSVSWPVNVLFPVGVINDVAPRRHQGFAILEACGRVPSAATKSRSR